MLTLREVRKRRSEGWQVGQIARYYQVDRVEVERLCLEGGFPYRTECPHCGDLVVTVGGRRFCTRANCRRWEARAA